MRKNPSIFLVFSFIALCIPSLDCVQAQAAETRHFCSMTQAVDQLIDLSGLEKQRQQPDIRYWAQQIVSEKLSDSSDGVKITWKDIYEMRGTVNTDACSRGKGFTGFLENLDSCLGAGIDAVGVGLAGTTAGRALMGTGLALAGPPGWVLTGGMIINQETFQCTPDLKVMAGEAALTAAFLVPWCKVPGIGTACKAAGREFNKGLLAVAKKVFKPNAARIISESEKGVVVELATNNGNILLQMSAKRMTQNPNVEVTVQRLMTPGPLAKKQPIPIKTPQAMAGKGPLQNRINFDGINGAAKAGNAPVNAAVVVAQAGGKTAKTAPVFQAKQQEVLLQKYSSLKIKETPSPTIHATAPNQLLNNADELLAKQIIANKSGQSAPLGVDYYKQLIKRFKDPRTSPISPKDLEAAVQRKTMALGVKSIASQTAEDCTLHAMANNFSSIGRPTTVKEIYDIIAHESTLGPGLVAQIKHDGMTLYEAMDVYRAVANSKGVALKSLHAGELFQSIGATGRGAIVGIQLQTGSLHAVYVEGIVTKGSQSFVSFLDSNAGGRLFLPLERFSQILRSGGVMIQP